MDEKCPKCHESIDGSWIFRSCKRCNIKLMRCDKCQKFTTFSWKQNNDNLSNTAVCDECSSENDYSTHVRKSSIYEKYSYAFKFVNSYPVVYPDYFSYDENIQRLIPIGEIKKDLGDFSNDFAYKGLEETLAGMDMSTARAFSVSFKTEDGKNNECIALSHETGLEMFFIGAGTFVAGQAAGYSLNRVLQTIEKKLNAWWRPRIKSYREEYGENLPDNLINQLLVRTPNWEISLDGKFSPEERERIIEHIDSVKTPHKSIKEFLESMDDEKLKKKIIESTKEIVRIE